MTPESALTELLDRVGANNGAAVFVSASELKQWPSRAVENMKSRKLLTKARPASSVVCPGCERQCTMPVETVATPANGSVSFVVCDKRSDINRVTVPEDQIIQWRFDAAALASFILASLRLMGAVERRDSTSWQIGIAPGLKRRQMLCLRVNGQVELVAGTASMALAEVIDFRNGAYMIDEDEVHRLVDSSSTEDSRYTPSTARREVRKQETEKMRERWRTMYRRMRRISPAHSDVWYSKQIAKNDPSGRAADTIRKHMKV